MQLASRTVRDELTIATGRGTGLAIGQEAVKTRAGPVARDTDWDTNDFNRYGHLVIESGQRYAHAQAQWARWAATQVEDLDTNDQPASASTHEARPTA